MNAAASPPPADPEFRTDVLTGSRILIAAGRSDRPNAVSQDPLVSIAEDPFAEGRESETPGERTAFRDTASETDRSGWQVRLVPNRYPAFVSPIGQSDHAEAAVELFPSEPACGQHDVVIECPDSRTRLVELTTEELTCVLTGWQLHVRQVRSEAKFPYVSVFRNEGFSAGASLAHCHSQIIASAHSSRVLEERIARSRAYVTAHNRDLVDDLLTAERAAGVRIVREGTHFVTLCPFAPRTAYHLRIIPVAEVSRQFADVGTEHLQELAEELLRQLRAVESVLGRFSFNLILPLPPVGDLPSFRWMIEILPRITRAAGWEYLTGIDIVTTTPEAAAKILRSRQEIVSASISQRPLAAFQWRSH